MNKEIKEYKKYLKEAIKFIEKKCGKDDESIPIIKGLSIINIWYRERDLITRFEHHMKISSRLYYCYLKGYDERRKRTKRNYEHKRVIDLE